ncbi:MAG: methionine--tRNA ligase subunit beta [Hydrogenobaculum sp.]|jgi:methionyl-tRNA synthetase (EC 6.1.1.10)
MEDKMITSEELISIEDFSKVKLALAKVLDVEEVPKSDKLLKLEVKIGDEKRTILAGIKQYYNKEELVGKKILVVYNLKPRKMMGFESQGMVLALSDGENFSLIVPDKDVKDGTFAR